MTKIEWTNKNKESRILTQLDEAIEKTLADLGINQNHEGMLKIVGSLDELSCSFR